MLTIGSKEISHLGFFRKEVIASVVEAFHKREVLYFANEALKEDPDNKLIQAIKETLQASGADK